ncbi:C-type lectin domain family 4 member e [Plakobranchus ocellatus]|uniref:C-type lectin domain family 4 member e n=1 Tax=Plakobranchus ocellatus TaxID=259542 RepID=A0AAV4B3N6_9GAST|nr:C-type lectin domain family 4 member e [Plakobranchus ocellatus]
MKIYLHKELWNVFILVLLSVAFCVCITVVGVICDERQVYLREDLSRFCRTLPLGESWISLSPVKCFAACISRFPETCRSMVYNQVTHTCTPGGTAFGTLQNVQTSIPKTNLNEKLFYAEFANPACNTSNGFALYDVCGTTACLYLSTSKVKYEIAVASCAEMNSNLIIANTLARLSLFFHVSLSYMNKDTLCWLSDNVMEGYFVWGNGETISDEIKDYIWHNGQPDNYNNDENCVATRHEVDPKPYGLNDVSCHIQLHFICES